MADMRRRCGSKPREYATQPELDFLSYVLDGASKTGWSEPVSEREFHPLKSSAFHGALLRQPSPEHDDLVLYSLILATDTASRQITYGHVCQIPQVLATDLSSGKT